MDLGSKELFVELLLKFKKTSSVFFVRKAMEARLPLSCTCAISIKLALSRISSVVPE